MNTRIKTKEELIKEAKLKEELSTIKSNKNKTKEDLVKEAKIKKELDKLNEPPPKFYYDVKVECMLPAVLTYRVLAETPQEASDMIRGMQPNAVHHKLIGRKEMMLRVYDAGSSMMRFMRKLFG